MRTLKLIFISVILLLTNNTCSKYDDGEIWNQIDDLDKRITAIENQLKSINADISSLSTLIGTLENRRYVSGITGLVDGYSITFSDGSKLTIKDGKDGVDGKDAPVFNVRFFNERYYWVKIIDGVTSWLTDDKGDMIPASGTEAVTPLMKIDSDGYWIISYNNGQSYSRIIDNSGNFVKASGKDGDSMFKSVEILESELRIVLIDGSEIIMPIGKQLPYKGIDLGLSVKWSSINFGAESTYEKGGLYLWGDVNNSGTVPYYSAPNQYYISGSEYDIVRANWGESWRMPNMSEIRELVTGCVWSKATINGVEGMKVTGKNGNSIFIPNTGYGIPQDGPIGQTTIMNAANGYYWIGESYVSGGTRMGYTLYINNSVPTLNYSWNASMVKMAIRPVRGY
ncbi:MAG: DUF4988 domain-containing protein [Porphyromonadaceae bacterium]|nr:DUF4988 domain-containing protein [Porphyromonadaceae bacterium]